MVLDSISDIFIPFVSIALAELGDKTQLSVLLLAAKTKKHLQLFLGVMLAFIMVDGSAILLCSWLAKVLPVNIIKIASGLVFIIFGALILFGARDEKAEDLELRNPFLSGFGLIFLSELGDKTQIACGLFATRYAALGVFIGSVLALALLSAMAIFLGRFVAGRINKRVISMIAGVLFIIIGLLFLLY